MIHWTFPNGGPTRAAVGDDYEGELLNNDFNENNTASGLPGQSGTTCLVVRSWRPE